MRPETQNCPEYWCDGTLMKAQILKLGVVVLTWNARLRTLRQEDCEFEANLSQGKEGKDEKEREERRERGGEGRKGQERGEEQRRESPGLGAFWILNFQIS